MEFSVNFTLSDETISNLLMAYMHSQNHTSRHIPHAGSPVYSPFSQNHCPHSSANHSNKCSHSKSETFHQENPVSNLNSDLLNTIVNSVLPTLIDKIRVSPPKEKSESKEEEKSESKEENILNQTLHETLNQTALNYEKIINDFYEYLLTGFKQTSEEGNPEDLIDIVELMTTLLTTFVKDRNLDESIISNFLSIKNLFTGGDSKIKRSELLQTLEAMKPFLENVRLIYKSLFEI